jgi:hypothetical protein
MAWHGMAWPVPLSSEYQMKGNEIIMLPFVKPFSFSLLFSVFKTKTLAINPKYRTLQNIFTFMSHQNTFSNKNKKAHSKIH